MWWHCWISALSLRQITFALGFTVHLCLGLNRKPPWVNALCQCHWLIMNIRIITVVNHWFDFDFDFGFEFASKLETNTVADHTSIFIWSVAAVIYGKYKAIWSTPRCCHIFFLFIFISYSSLMNNKTKQNKTDKQLLLRNLMLIKYQYIHYLFSTT